MSGRFTVDTRHRPAVPDSTLLCLVFAVALVHGCDADGGSRRESPSLRVVEDPESLIVRGVALGPIWSERSGGQSELARPAALEQVFAVWRRTSGSPEASCSELSSPSLLGRYLRIDQELVFEPRFPLSPGEQFQVCVDLEALRPLLAGTFAAGFEGHEGDSGLSLVFDTKVSLLAESQPTVAALWPDTEVVPENLLRFYLHFSEPMRRQGVGDHVSLLDSKGAAIDDAFVDIPNGLWDAKATRLTLFLHPGRIKRGVGPRQRQGPVLTAGASYVLRVDAGLLSARAVPLGRSFEHVFAAEVADRQSPDPVRWSVEAPLEQTESVTLRFDEVLDVEQLSTFAWVEDASSRPVVGTVVPGSDGRSWSFAPADPWRQQSYRIVTSTSIEDLAGNTSERLFDVDTRGKVSAGRTVIASAAKPETERTLEFPFDVGKVAHRSTSTE